jgi:multiple sugar transport system permease protein
MLIGVPFTILMALAMNRPVREIPVYRAALYLPSILPLFALSFIVIWILNPRYGLLNFLLSLTGMPAINWLGDPTWARMAIVLMAQLGAGQVALIYLSGLRAIPSSLYEAATIDGANSLQKFWSITLPLLTPIILYQSIIGIGFGLQVFTQAYIITDGGPNNATMFYVFYLYRNAFSYSQMGYASAMAWILFIISLGLAFVVFRWSRRWVTYDLA